MIPGVGIAEGVLGLGQSAYGLWQAHKGNQMASANKRPTYEIPDEINQNLNQAQQMALTGLPDEQKQQYVNNIQRSQNFGLGASSDRKGGLAGLGGLVQQGNDASMNLLSADAGARRQNQMGLMNARTQLANYKDKAFEFNKANPYYENAAAARAMQGAGAQNIWGGLGTTAGALGRRAVMNHDDDREDMGLGNDNRDNYNSLKKKQQQYVPASGFNMQDYGVPQQQYNPLLPQQTPWR